MNASPDPNPTVDRPLSVVDPASQSSGTVNHPGGSVTHGVSWSAAHTAASLLPAVPGYRVLRELARGGMGRVLAAHHLTLDREVAIKLLLPGAAPDRFVRESKITARLPHPGIPPVYEMGTLGDGSPFLAMKLVAGHTLAVERKTAARPRLLQIFTQVCQAVGFAHSRGVIHRDLKPGNIMVGAFGEVQVMDWGLAKELAVPDAVGPPAGVPTASDADDPDQTVARGSAGESTEDQTQAGSVLGTPAYMAPEQARGESATPASDVYGLGAILYTLISGGPPYSGAYAADVLKQVITTDPPLFAQPDPSVPPALVAICKRAMARNPTDRYPSAEAVAADVQNWLTGERVSAYRERWTDRVGRWARQRRAGVMTAAGVLIALTSASVVTAVLLWQEGKRTKGEWDRAEKNSVSATERGDSLLDLARYQDQYIGQVELAGGQAIPDPQRRAMLDRTVVGYERVLALKPDEVEFKASLARTHRFRGNLARGMLDMGEAEKSYREARRHYAELADSHPEDDKYRTDLALVTRETASLLRGLGRLKEAGETTDAVIALYEQIDRAAPDSPVHQRNLAFMLLNRGELASQMGEFTDAERWARRSAGLYTRLQNSGVPGPPQDPLFHAMADGVVAIALREQGKPADAAAVQDQLVPRLTGYLKTNPTRDFQHECCLAQIERAVTLSTLPARRATGVADLDAAVLGCEKLAKQFPQFPTYLRSQGAATLHRGRLNALLGQREAAGKDLAAAAAIFEGLVAKHPDIPLYRNLLGQTYLELGQFDTDAAKAGEWFHKSREMLDWVAARSPDDAKVKKARAELDAATQATK